MKDIFENLSVIDNLTAKKAVWAFDFDGTLAAIVQSPSEARISNMTLGYLNQLNGLVPVAIISGRSLTDLQERLPFNVKYPVGNHGLEGLFGFESSQTSLDEIRKTCKFWCEFLETSLIEKKGLIGIEIEDKKFSVAVHYRHAENKDLARLEIINSISKLNLLPRMILAKSVVNIVPPGSPNKGESLMHIMRLENAEAAFYIGDDDSDEDVFALNDERIVTVRVGFKESTQAQYFMKAQGELNKLLRHILDHARYSAGKPAFRPND